MTFRIIYDGIEQDSIYNRRTHQPPARRNNSGRTARARAWDYGPSPWHQYAYPHSALPPPPPAYIEPIFQRPLAYQENRGHAVYREARHSVRPARARHVAGTGSDLGARHRPPRSGTDRDGPKVCIPLSSGPRLVAFYPNYSIPLSDSAMNAPRCFSLVTQLEGVRLEQGASAFSLYSMWQPVIEERAQSYLPTQPEDVAIQRHNILSQLRDLSQRTRYLHAAMTNDMGTTTRGSQSMRYPPLTFAEKSTQSVTRAPHGSLRSSIDSHHPEELGPEVHRDNNTNGQR